MQDKSKRTSGTCDKQKESMGAINNKIDKAKDCSTIMKERCHFQICFFFLSLSRLAQKNFNLCLLTVFVWYMWVTMPRALYNGSKVNNHSPKWRWTVVDIYREAKRRGKYVGKYVYVGKYSLRWIIVLVYTETVKLPTSKSQFCFKGERLLILVLPHLWSGKPAKRTLTLYRLPKKKRLLSVQHPFKTNR